MVMKVSGTFSYIEIPLAITERHEERIRALQTSLNFVKEEERDHLIESLRDFLGGFRAATKEQIIAKYFKEIRLEIS